MTQTIKLGTYLKEEGLKIRQSYKKDYGKDLRIRLRGRGKRVIKTENGTIYKYFDSLPLAFADKVAIYIDILEKTNE